MADPVILAVDLGTSGMKVALITVRWEVLGWESEPVKLILTADGGANNRRMNGGRLSLGGKPLDGAAVWFAVRRCVPCAVPPRAKVLFRWTAWPALMNCILWMDMRGAPYLKKQFKGLVNISGVGLAHITALGSSHRRDAPLTGKIRPRICCSSVNAS